LVWNNRRIATCIKHGEKNMSEKKRYEHFKSHMNKPIITDGTQCECLKQGYRPFIVGGDCKPVYQCPNKATVKIVSHLEQEKNLSPMYLCAECLILFKKDTPGYESDYEINPITPKKTRKRTSQ
jgi:hypothetical protein